MLPTEPQNQLDKKLDNVDLSDLIPLEQPTSKAAHKFPIVLLQLASRSLGKTGHFVAKNPFWVLLIGSLGVHAAVALFTPNPLKKAPPEEILVSTPIIQLPPRNRGVTSSSQSSSSKSALDNLFVKPLDNQAAAPLDSPLRRVESDDSFEQNRAIRDALPEDTYEPAPAKTPKPKPESDRLASNSKVDNRDNRIDNSNPKPANETNIKPELQNNGIKNEQNSPTPQNDTISKQPKVNPANKSNNGELRVDNVATIYTTNGRILELLAKNSLRNTQIAPQEANIPDPEKNREREVAWIAPKITDFAGKTGSVVFMWLVKPDGEVEAVFVKPSGHKELDDAVREVVKDYKFKPIDPSEKDVYRLVTAKYDFPPK